MTKSELKLPKMSRTKNRGHFFKKKGVKMFNDKLFEDDEDFIFDDAELKKNIKELREEMRTLREELEKLKEKYE